jgi:phage terminase large subunit GpA-like protein
MPTSTILLREYDAGRFTRFAGSGPTQTGKTLVLLVIPLAFAICELRQSFLIAAPTLEIAQEIWTDKVRDWFLRTRYADLLPTEGLGSKLGKVSELRFRNGAILYFRGAGRHDQSLLSITVRNIAVTEVDSMDELGAETRQADPVSKAEARGTSFGSRARFYLDSTFTTPEGRINREITQRGTDTRAAIPCLQCGSYVIPERKDLVGWQEAPDVRAAGLLARIKCPECGGLWTEAERLRALRFPIPVSAGQSIDRQGRVSGEPRQTDTFGFHWSWYHAPMREMAMIGRLEWLNARNPDEAAERDLCQHHWAIPYASPVSVEHHVDREMVMNKMGDHVQGTMAESCAIVTAFVDLGIRRSWFVVCGWTPNAQGFVIDYGLLDIAQGVQTDSNRVLAALNELYDQKLSIGWRRGSSIKRPDLVLVDAGWEPLVAQNWVRACREAETSRGDEPCLYLPSKGMGSGYRQEQWQAMRKARGRTNGNNWFVQATSGQLPLFHLHSDFWKQQVHEGFRAGSGVPGSITLFRVVNQREHLSFARQVTGEERQMAEVPGKGTVIRWVKRPGEPDNHYLDCMAGARAGADFCGARTTGDPMIRAREPAESTMPTAPAKAPGWSSPRDDPERPKQGGSGWKIGR